MKKLMIYGMLALAGMGLTSCNDILDQDPLDSYTDEAVWGDLALSEVYLNAQYSYLMPENAKGTRFSHFTDEVFQKHLYGSENYTQGYINVDNANIGWDDTMWDPWYTYYKAIKNLNIFLERIDDVPGDADWRDAQKGQALFLRAWNYHMLYSLFGRVVIVDHTYDLDSEFVETRADLDDVADFIVGDLDKAAALLPLKYDNANYGRITKGAALALKSRVLLYKASPLFGTPSREKWQAASDAAKAVIDLNQYYLKPVSGWEDYAKLFYEPGNPEAIFVKLYDPKYGAGENNSWIFQVPCGNGNGFEGWGNFNPTQNIVEKFEMADGSKANWDMDYWDENPYDRDFEIRFKADIFCDGDIWGYGSGKRPVEVFHNETIVDWGTAKDENGDEYEYPIYEPAGKDSSDGEFWWNASETGYSMRKFLDPNWDPAGTTMHCAPWMFIRYAEILLNYAECQIELGNNGEAANYINMIRHRALLPDFTGDIREAYDHERQIELLFEGNRWFDQRRWMRLADEYNNVPLWGIEIIKSGDVTNGSNERHISYSKNRSGYWDWDDNAPNEEGGLGAWVWIDGGPFIVSTRRWAGDHQYWLPVPRWELNKAPQLDAAPYSK